MKVDKRDLRHWFALALFGVNAVLAWGLRMVRRRVDPSCIVLYGHKLGGNLLALHREANRGSHWRTVFLTMDGAYARELALGGVATQIAWRPGTVRLLSRAHAVISDHGLHAMQWLPGRSDLRFYDVWHGIPFKGFDASDFRVQHRYDEAWVASPRLRQLYVNRFGFSPERVIPTGYARTDCLVRRGEDPEAIRRALPVRIPERDRLILFAPTWKQDAQQRSIWPFGRSEREFLSGLSEVASAAQATVVVRTHLNSTDRLPTPFPGIAWLPYAAYPDTERLLLASDVLVCDWSSIAFDFLLLDRPAIFLDVEPPFRKGFSLGPEHRYGPVVKDASALAQMIISCLTDAPAYWQEHGPAHARVREEIYGDCADGKAAQRCLDRLQGGVTAGSSR